MKDENYYIVQGWMVNKLELSGSDLICYAIIYGFSQNESSEFTGSLNYIASFMACSKKTVQRSIDNLISKKLIAKRTETINNVQVNHFSVNMDAINGYGQNTWLFLTLANLS